MSGCRKLRISSKRTDYPAITAAKAVYAPILGVGLHKFPLPLKYISRIDKIWKKRIAVLQAAGWEPGQKVIERCQNCMPAVVTCDNTASGCSQLSICPYCYARNVESAYRRIEGLVKKKRARRRLLLLGFSVTKSYPAEINLYETMMHVAEERSEFLDTYLPGVFGAVTNFTITPAKEPRTGEVYWATSNRCLAIMPESYEYHADLCPCGDSHKRLQILEFSRKTLSELLSRFYRYPPGLLYGDPGKVVEYLRIRKDFRLTASFGDLRERASHRR